MVGYFFRSFFFFFFRTAAFMWKISFCDKPPLVSRYYFSELSWITNVLTLPNNSFTTLFIFQCSASTKYFTKTKKAICWSSGLLQSTTWLWLYIYIYNLPAIVFNGRMLIKKGKRKFFYTHVHTQFTNFDFEQL